MSDYKGAHQKQLAMQTLDAEAYFYLSLWQLLVVISVDQFGHKGASLVLILILWHLCHSCPTNKVSNQLKMHNLHFLWLWSENHYILAISDYHSIGGIFVMLKNFTSRWLPLKPRLYKKKYELITGQVLKTNLGSLYAIVRKVNDNI